MKIKYVNLSSQYLKEKKALLKVIDKTLATGEHVGGKHIREFEKQRMIFSASNFNMSQIAATYSHLNFSDIENIFENKDYFGFYVMQLRNYSKAKFLKLSKKKVEKDFLSMSSLKSWVYEEDIGKMCAFLISEDALRISGQIIGVNGNEIRLD